MTVEFRDTDPRPLATNAAQLREINADGHFVYRGMTRGHDEPSALPTRGAPALAEDERLIESLAAHLYAELDTFGGEGRIARAIRAWRDGARS